MNDKAAMFLDTLIKLYRLHPLWLTSVIWHSVFEVHKCRMYQYCISVQGTRYLVMSAVMAFSQTESWDSGGSHMTNVMTSVRCLLILLALLVKPPGCIKFQQRKSWGTLSHIGTIEYPNLLMHTFYLLTHQLMLLEVITHKREKILTRQFSLDQEDARICSLPLSNTQAQNGWQWLLISLTQLYLTLTWDLARSKVPSLSVLAKRFGGWVRACSLAGNGVYRNPEEEARTL
jgi:hypothetical protein